MASTATLCLLVVAAIHAGFQGTVSTVVYPALARVEPGEWLTSQEAHRYAIVPMVAVCYLGALGSLAWCFVTDPTARGLWIAAAGFALSMGTTALVAAPTHGTLMKGHDPLLVRRLLRSDWVRTLGAVIALAGAVGAASV